MNNTNPILDEASPEHRAVLDAGWEIAQDGMELDTCDNRSIQLVTAEELASRLQRAAVARHPFHLLMPEGKLTRGQLRHGRSIASITRARFR